jgi:hypothetical protein
MLGSGELREDNVPFKDDARGCSFNDIRFIPGLHLELERVNLYIYI